MQLRLHKFLFDNVFAYGEGNLIVLDEDRVTQIIGANGTGKSSMPNALEELFYNKNSRGIKKASVVNRKASEYWMEAEFSIGEDSYTISKTVKSSAKVVLIKNGEDISGHTATQTYKLLEKEIGLDFSTFSKLVYQSMKSSLDFLSATDTNRKKFLIGLLGLEKYAEVEEQLKLVAKKYSSELDKIDGAVVNTRKWIANNSSIGDIQSLVDVPVENPELQNELLELKTQEKGITEANARVVKARQAKKLADNKVTVAQNKVLQLGVPPAPVDSNKEEIQKVTQDLMSVTTNMNQIKTVYTRFKAGADRTECPTCGTGLDVSEAIKARDLNREKFEALIPKRDELKAVLEGLEASEAKHKTYADYLTTSQEAHNSLDLASKYLEQVLEDYPEHDKVEASAEDLQAQILRINREAQNLRISIDKALDTNRTSELENKKLETLLDMLQEKKAELIELEEKLNGLMELVSDYKTLVKAFGSKGLVAYKIESSIKALEETLNEYLSTLTSGRFALGFELSGTKLDVVIYDESELVEVNSLSSGEFANVQIATLLAIRKILSAINSVEINVLFLDEVISVIDGNGRDRLIELLLEETELNTLLVSHEYSHPLAEKLYVTKEGGLSRITKEI